MKYHAIPARIIVKPFDADIFEPTATVVEIADEAAGPFVRITQPGAEHEHGGIAVDAPDWPLISDAIQQMLNVAQGLDADKLPVPPNAGNKPPL